MEPPVEKLHLTPHLYQDLQADPPVENPDGRGWNAEGWWWNHLCTGVTNKRGPLHSSAGSASLKFASILFQNCLCASFTVFRSKQLCMLTKASHHHRQCCMPPMLPRTFCQPVLIREDSYFDSLLCSYQFLTQFLEDPIPLQPPFTRTALESGIVHSTNLLRWSHQWDTAVSFVVIRQWGGLRSGGLSCLTAVHGPPWTSYWLPVKLDPEQGLLPAGS